jgi:hypothetical protein
MTSYAYVGHVRAVAEPDDATIDEDVAVVIDVLAKDYDTDGTIVRLDTFDVIAYAPDFAAMEIISDGDSLRVAPRPHYFGRFSSGYRILDKHDAKAEQPGIVTVAHVSHPPKAKDDAVTTEEDDELCIDRGTRTEHGWVTDEGCNELNVPELDWSWEDAVDYTIRSQNGEEASANVAVTVTPVNDPPIIPDQEYFFAVL